MTSDMDAGIDGCSTAETELEFARQQPYLVCRNWLVPLPCVQAEPNDHEPGFIKSACFAFLHSPLFSGKRRISLPHIVFILVRRFQGYYDSGCLRSNGGPDAANGCPADQVGTRFNGLLRGGPVCSPSRCSDATACIGKWHLLEIR